MASDFDEGPKGPFRALCSDYPDATVYANGFRTTWGPIFYRGRLDGSARILAIGQDPAQHEAVVRRIFVGEAGKRVQGFLAKLGFTTHYVMVNTYVYGIFNQSIATPHLKDAPIADYRHKWFDAILAPGRIQAVVAFGSQADEAWQHYKTTASGSQVTVPYAHVMHPTAPGHGHPVITLAMLLANWNQGLRHLHPLITNPDISAPLDLYGAAFTPAELPPIPALDVPPGTPAWMRETSGWVTMAPAPGTQRANYVVSVP